MACSIPSIPNLSEGNLLNCINQVANMALTSNDLKNPTYEMLSTICNAFACSLLNISLEQITQLPLHVLETIAHPELSIEEAVGPLMCIKTLEYLFPLTGINDFSMNDLRTPTSKKRTKKLLCALVNFYQFYTSNEKVKEEVLAKVELLSKGIKENTDKRRILMEKIAQLKYERTEKQKAVQEMNLSALKAKQEDVAEAMEGRNCQVEKQSYYVEELQNFITVEKSSKLIKQAQLSLQDRIARGKALMQKENAISALGDFTPSVLKTVQGTRDYSRRYTISCNKYEELTDTSMELDNKMKELSKQIELKTQRIDGTMSSIQRAASKIDHKAEQEREIASKLKQTKMQYERERESIQKELDEVNSKLKAFTEMGLLQEENHKKNMKALNKRFRSLAETATQYKSNVNSQCRVISEKLQNVRECQRHH